METDIDIEATDIEATGANFVAPHQDDRVLVRTPHGDRVEHLGKRSSYTYQLEAFVSAVHGGPRPPTDFDDAARTLRVLDRIRSLVGVQLPGAAA